MSNGQIHQLRYERKSVEKLAPGLDAVVKIDLTVSAKHENNSPIISKLNLYTLLSHT